VKGVVYTIVYRKEGKRRSEKGEGPKRDQRAQKLPIKMKSVHNRES